MMDFEEGEELSLPCQHCSSVSLGIVIRTGTQRIQCAKCGGLTQVTVGRLDDQWRIKREKIETPHGTK